MSDRWCQNKRCAEKKNQAQIRGNKGNKYYQSYKAKPYYNYMFCSQRCQDQFLNENWQTCLNAVGEIGKQIIPVEDAWYVEYHWGQYYYDEETSNSGYRNQGYYLSNKLKGVKQLITKEQAQTPEQIAHSNNWATISDEQARELAVSLGLAS
jgi:YHS domain-containing protein